MLEYFLMGVLAPIFLNLMHLCVGIYVVIQRGNMMSLGFSGMGFITKTIGMLFLTWLGVSKLGLDYQRPPFPNRSLVGNGASKE